MSALERMGRWLTSRRCAYLWLAMALTEVYWSLWPLVAVHAVLGVMCLLWPERLP